MTVDEAKIYHSIFEASRKNEINWEIKNYYNFSTKFLGFKIEVLKEEIFLSKGKEKIKIFLTKELKEKENLYDFLWYEIVEKPQQSKLIERFITEYDRWKNR